MASSTGKGWQKVSQSTQLGLLASLKMICPPNIRGNPSGSCEPPEFRTLQSLLRPARLKGQSMGLNIWETMEIIIEQRNFRGKGCYLAFMIKKKKKKTIRNNSQARGLELSPQSKVSMPCYVLRPELMFRSRTFSLKEERTCTGLREYTIRVPSALPKGPKTH